jgi:site-specific DNA-methyltransferase (adenine-specific)
MRGLSDASVDAIVTDPPYGLGFMGKAWDDLPPGLEWARECLRVLKPGGHLLAFGGSRTYHRLAVAVEDAGFEVRDQMMWLYGSGFPKSLDVSKAIDKAAGVEREVVGQKLHARKGVATAEQRTVVGAGSFGEAQLSDVTLPATPDAKKWSGWGTALKPAHEPIVVARKPLVGTVAENVLRFGTGALNIDACRIAGGKGTGNWKGVTDTNIKENVFAGGWDGSVERDEPNLDSGGVGRWPANLILDEEAGRLIDEQSGELMSGANPTRRGSDKFRHAYGDFVGQEECERARGADAGGASRFFYCAKAGKAERNAGLDAFEINRPDNRTVTGMGTFEEKGVQPQRNHHPTVKPISLMAYLVRLVTPPAGTVLDPFLGSGTTGCAAALEGFDFIGIEREPDYIAIAEARIAWWEKHKGDAQVSDILAAGKGRDEVEDAGQLDLLGDTA